MKELFASASLKLTVWYLTILMALSLTFSVVIYQLSIGEISSRLGIFQDQFSLSPLDGSETVRSVNAFRIDQLHKAELNLLVSLFYTNLIILCLGGLGSYVLAKRTLQPIEESHEAQARFTSDASHELRTPLAVMKSELEVALRDTSLSKREMKELLESNLEEVNRLTELSTALLKLSKGSYLDIKLKSLDLKKIIHEMLNHPSVDKPRISLKSPKKIQVKADQTLLKELFLILLDNAQRYSPNDSPIEISVKKQKDNIIISIVNTGDGINEDDLPHVFERFYRGDKSRTQTNEAVGYGLGLSLAKQIVDMHGALIGIESIPTKQTTVTLQFKNK